MSLSSTGRCSPPLNVGGEMYKARKKQPGNCRCMGSRGKEWIEVLNPRPITLSVLPEKLLEFNPLKFVLS